MCFRGNSKYHYYGLRIKSGSPLLRLMDEQQHMAMRQQPFSQKNRFGVPSGGSRTRQDARVSSSEIAHLERRYKSKS